MARLRGRAAEARRGESARGARESRRRRRSRRDAVLRPAPRHLEGAPRDRRGAECRDGSGVAGARQGARPRQPGGACGRWGIRQAPRSRRFHPGRRVPLHVHREPWAGDPAGTGGEAGSAQDERSARERSAGEDLRPRARALGRESRAGAEDPGGAGAAAHAAEAHRAGSLVRGSQDVLGGPHPRRSVALAHHVRRVQAVSERGREREPEHLDRGGGGSRREERCDRRGVRAALGPGSPGRVWLGGAQGGDHRGKRCRACARRGSSGCVGWSLGREGAVRAGAEAHRGDDRRVHRCARGSREPTARRGDRCRRRLPHRRCRRAHRPGGREGARGHDARARRPVHRQCGGQGARGGSESLGEDPRPWWVQGCGGCLFGSRERSDWAHG